jgi:hypothetical protein
MLTLPDHWIAFAWRIAVKESAALDAARVDQLAKVLASTGTWMPHACDDLTPARLIVTGFPCAVRHGRGRAGSPDSIVGCERRRPLRAAMPGVAASGVTMPGSARERIV